MWLDYVIHWCYVLVKIKRNNLYQSNTFSYVLIWCSISLFPIHIPLFVQSTTRKSRLLPFVTFRACVFMFSLSIHRSLQLRKYSVYNSVCLQQTFLINCNRNTVISSLIAAQQIKSQHDTETMVTTFSRQIKKEVLSRKVAEAKL